MFALCLDWNYVGAGGGAIGSLFTPLSTQLSLYAGVVVCMCGPPSPSMLPKALILSDVVAFHSASAIRAMCGTPRICRSCLRYSSMRTGRNTTSCRSSTMTLR